MNVAVGVAKYVTNEVGSLIPLMHMGGDAATAMARLTHLVLRSIVATNVLWKMPERWFTMADEKQYTEVQPKDGEAVIHCGHLEGKTHHFFKIAGGGEVKFVRPNGSFGKASWIVACGKCMKRAKGDPKKIQIRGDGTWKGDKPAVKKTEDSGKVFEGPSNKPEDN